MTDRINQSRAGHFAPRVIPDYWIKLANQIEMSPRRPDLTLLPSTVPPSPAWSSSALVSPAAARAPFPPFWTEVIRPRSTPPDGTHTRAAQDAQIVQTKVRETREP
jgi:hypothetical protein